MTPSGSVAQDINTHTTPVDTPGSQNGSDDICYGTVYRTALRLMGDMLQLDYKLQRTKGSYGFGYASFEVRPSKENITLHFVDGMPLGSTNMHFNNGVQRLLPRFPIRMEGIVQTAKVRDCIGRAKKTSDAIVRVDINVYGPMEDAAAVGKILSDGKIWLQKPDILKRGLQYDNPQFLRHLDGSINFVRYHGGKRKVLKDKLQGTDMIFTTYSTLVRDFQHKQQRKCDSSLHEIDFFRIVLDEAHNIRRKDTLFNKAVSELSSKSRWCLTGTPIQNKFEDIGALFAFIRARPFHSISMFRRFISNPFSEGGKRRAVAVERLVTLMDSLCIRRTRARLKLPEAREIRKELVFSDLEQRQYDKTVSDMSRRLKNQVGNSKTKHNFGLFSVNLQLRILCNHGTYQNQLAWKQSAWLDMWEYALMSMVATGDVLISRHLKLANIAFERIDGQTSLRQREKILEAFAKRKDLPVLIMTTGAGAYGLNLTVANRIFIIEPQWNPAVENQAICRAIRLGQADNVQIIRYTIKKTVEQIGKRKFRPANFPDIRVEPDEIEQMFRKASNEFTKLLTAEERDNFHEARIEDVRRVVFNLQRWVYTDLLEFHIKAQRFFRHHEWKQVFKADWADFDTRFQGILGNLQRQKDLAGLLARYTSTPSSGDIQSILMEKLNTYAIERGRLSVELASKEKEEREKKYWRVMEWLACLRPGEGEYKTTQEQVADHEYLAETPYISKRDVECKLASLCLRYLTLDFFDPNLETTEVNEYIKGGWLSLQDYAVSKWFQHLDALAKIYKEEGFGFEGSLDALHSSTSVFLDYYADEMLDKPVDDDVRNGYAHLAGQKVYEDITRIMSHVTRHMKKGPSSRSEICIQPLKKAFERNRKLIEKLSAESSRNPAVRGTLVGYYGRKGFKCPFVTCLDFYEGFNSAKTRDKHVDRHNRPWVCEVPHCTSISFGFISNKDLEKHMRDYHPDESDLACIAHNNTILAEHAAPGTSSTTSSSLAAAILPKIGHSSPAKLTYTHDRLFVHYIADSPNSPSNAADEQLSSHAALTYLVVAQAELGRRIPFAFLLEMKKKFLAQFKPDETGFDSLPAYGCAAFNSTIKQMLATYAATPPSDALANARKEIDSVKDIMSHNIESVLERGERIDLLVTKTDQLGSSAHDFRLRSKTLRRRMWFRNVRLMLLLGFVVVFLIYLFVGFGCGLPAWKGYIPASRWRTAQVSSPTDLSLTPLLRISNEFTPIIDERGDTLIYIGPPAKTKDQLQSEYNHIQHHFNRFYLVESNKLKALNSSKINRLLGLKACIFAAKRFKTLDAYQALSRETKSAAKYHVDLRPAQMEDEAVMLLTELSCSKALRHHSALERLLHAACGQDPKLDSAPKMWTFFSLALFFGCAGHPTINQWISSWLRKRGNNNFIQNNPEAALRIGMGIMHVNLVRVAFSILVGEKALMLVCNEGETTIAPRPLSIHGRVLENVDDDEQNRIDHAASSLVSRMRSVFKSVVDDLDWMLASTEYQKLLNAEADSQAAESAINLAQTRLKAFVKARCLSILHRRLWELSPELEKDPQKAAPFRHGLAPCFEDRYSNLQPNARPFTRSFWIELSKCTFDFGVDNNDPIRTNSLLKELSAALASHICDPIIYPSHLFLTDDPIPVELIDHLLNLDESEWKFLPLWAGGLDDGSGGVFADGFYAVGGGGSADDGGYVGQEHVRFWW
ncbi:hypothetical protein DV737_g539, partial [Chaetothyriales sp. CBS 132003]